MHVLSLVFLAAGASAGMPPADPPAATDAVGFAQSLAECESTTFSTPHPLVPGFDSAHKIEGEHDGACRYTQSMPGNMRMECAFSMAGRQAFAAEFEAMAAGRMHGSSKQAPAWAGECEIVTASGQRLPAFGETVIEN